MKKFIMCATSRENILIADYLERFFATDTYPEFTVYVDTNLNMVLKPRNPEPYTPKFEVFTVREGSKLRFEVEVTFPMLSSTEKGIMDDLDDFQHITKEWINYGDIAAFISSREFDLDDILDDIED